MSKNTEWPFELQSLSRACEFLRKLVIPELPKILRLESVRPAIAQPGVLLVNCNMQIAFSQTELREAMKIGPDALKSLIQSRIIWYGTELRMPCP